MNNQIGFRYPGRDLPEVAAKAKPNKQTELRTAAQILHEAGFEKAVDMLVNYLQPGMYPFLQGRERNDWLAEEMGMIKERYFESLGKFNIDEFRAALIAHFDR